MAPKVILKVVTGPIQGEVFTFECHDTFLFGRHGTCHAQIGNDPLVSRHHFILEVNPPAARLRDLGSRNGTCVNGVRYGGPEADGDGVSAAGPRRAAVALNHGDRITVGATGIDVAILAGNVCCLCSSPIPAIDEPLAEWKPGSFVCAECRQYRLGVRGRHSVDGLRPTETYVPRCGVCQRDVAAEVPYARGGSYVCDSCRSSFQSDAGVRRGFVDQRLGVRKEAAGLALPGYQIEAEVGRGGMGAVFRARRTSDNQLVAIKVMLAQVAVEEHARRLFLREIDLTRQLQHPHIVRLLDSGAVDSLFFFAMEYCHHGNLLQLLRRSGGKLAVSVAAPLILQCLDGLRHAHEQKLVHRDLKPQNILLDEREQRLVARIADFGLAKEFEKAGLSGMTATSAVAGTYRFMPREQLMEFRYVRPASDIWSMGATFYHAVTGQFPLDFPPRRDPVDVIVHDEPVPIRQRQPDLSPAIAAVIDRAISVDPSSRFPTAAEMHAALKQALAMVS